MPDLFTEIFPINIDKLPAMAAYELQFAGDGAANGSRLAYRFNQHLPGQWVWTGKLLLTDTPPPDEKLDSALLAIQPQAGQLLKQLTALNRIADWQATADAAAAFMLHTDVASLMGQLRQALRTHGVRIPRGYVRREPAIAACVVEGMPSLILSIQSFILYELDLHHYIQEQGTEQLSGLGVKWKTEATRHGRIKSVPGTINELREALLNQCNTPEMERLILDAPHDALVVRVEHDGMSEDALAATLNITLDTADFNRFGLDRNAVSKALNLTPVARSQLVRSLSDILKTQNLIDKAYNSRQQPSLFASIDFKPGLEYKGNRVRPYDVQQMGHDFLNSGLYARHPRFADQPIRIATINTLDKVADDFIEALARQIVRDFDMEIERIKARNVRVLSADNLVSAVRVVEKESPHIVLAFFPDADGEHDPYYDVLKSQTLGKGVASHAVYESTVHEPNAMGMVIMAMLAKTGNVPYGLAEPLDFANRVVGLDWVHEKMTRGDRVVGMSRIYRRDGLFMTYFMDIHELESDLKPPLSILENLLPVPIIQGKDVILHHAGTFSDELLGQLSAWGQQNDARFYPIEIITRNVPYLYGLEAGVSTPPWGSVFLMNEREALIVSDVVSEETIATPLWVRLPFANLPIEQAVYSVLAWTLLHYGTVGSRRVPVTIRNSDNLAGWLARGMLPRQAGGNVPFWL